MSEDPDLDRYDPAGIDAVARGISVRHWDHVNEETREVLRAGARELLDDYFALARPAPTAGDDIERCAQAAAEAYHGGCPVMDDEMQDEWGRVARAVLAEAGRAAPPPSDLQAVPDLGATDAEALARRLHEAYERLAPDYGYRTREASAKPWPEVPEVNRRLMTAVCAELLGRTTTGEADRG